MMAPEVYERARADAAMHVQLLRVGALERPGHEASARVHGRVVRVFRDRDRRLHWAKGIAFDVSIIDRSRSGPPELSGRIYHDGDRLARARWLEVFLDYDQGEFRLVRSQLVVIRRPTWEPVCGPEAKGFLGEGGA